MIHASKKLLVLALVLVTSCARSHVMEGPPDASHFTLDNGQVRLQFEQQGEGLSLVAIQRLPDGNVISLEPYSGDWRINLKTRNHPKAELSLALSRKTETKPKSEDGVLQAGGHVFEAHWSEQEDRDVRESPYTDGTIRLRSIDAKRDRLTATWEGEGRIYDETCRFEVSTRWILEAGDPVAHTAIDVRLLPAEGQERSPIYLSSVDYPIYRIQPVGEHDRIAVPWIGGHLYHHPVKNEIRIYGNEPGAISMPVYAYYDEGTGDCLYISNTDVRGNYKIIDTHTEEGYLLHRVRQIPPDVFESRHYRQPYEDVLGVLEGDWITAAETYRAFLAEHADWYKGPVGADTNPMPQRMKDCMMVATHQWGPHGTEFERATHEEYLAETADMPWVRDPWVTTLDAMGEDHRLTSDRFNCPVFSTWYGGHYEGAIAGEKLDENGRSHYLYSDDNEEEATELTRAVAVAQEGNENIVAPYINAQTGYYFGYNKKDPGPYTDRNYGVLASAIVLETGKPAARRDNNMTTQCPAAPWWREHLSEVLRDHYRRWGIRGIYLDYFMNFHTCYSEQHDHKPGGGDFMIRGKLYQMCRIRELLAEEGIEDFTVAMESVCGPYSAEANLGYRHMFSNWGTSEHSESIPYFEWVFDNMKFYRVTSHGSNSGAEGASIWSWVVANEVFLFGHVPSAGNGLVNWQKFFGNPDGEPYYRFLTKLADLLGSDGFKKYHNGSMARLPVGQVTPEGDFHVRVTMPVSAVSSGDEIYYDHSSHGNRDYAKPYVLSVLPRGMFKSPEGDLAFVLCNPWVGANPFSEVDRFAYEFTLDPAQYRGFPAKYRLTAVSPGDSKRDLGVRTGQYTVSGELRLGELIYWTMERLER